MGMAASQARLLSLTARIHDVEYKAQSIQNAKIQLATQSDQVYKDYLEALDATTLTFKDIDGNRIPANFSNIRGINAIKPGNKDSYALLDDSGFLIVEQDEFDMYNNCKNKSPSAFALAMIIGDDSANSTISYETLINNFQADNYDNVLETDIKNDINNKLKSINDLETKEKTEENEKQIKKLKEEVEDLLFKHAGKEIFKSRDNENKDYDFDYEKFKYYVNLFKQIKAAGGCISIEDKKFANALNSDNSYKNSSEWLKKMVECGKISFELVNIEKDGSLNFNTTSVGSDTNLEYTTTSTIDKAALAKAEAKYENDTRKINQKDKAFDMDLSKLDTERSALTKEYESVKKVVSENIDRTFGIFS